MDETALPENEEISSSPTSDGILADRAARAERTDREAIRRATEPEEPIGEGVVRALDRTWLLQAALTTPGVSSPEGVIQAAELYEVWLKGADRDEKEG